MRMAWRSTPRDDMSRNAVAFAATTFAFVAMQSIFSMYYVDLFLNVYGVSSWWFYVSQALYLVWNAVNDPLFGWIQDMSSSPGRRQQAILHGAPLFAASFLVPWFDMGAGSELLTGLHMVFALCFWDCMFTYVVLAQCALFAEISPNLEDRTRVLQYSQVASMLGSCSVFVAHVLWDKSNLLPFRVMCVVVAVVAYLCFRYTGLHARTHPHFRPSEPAEGAKNGEKSGDLADGSLRNFLKLTMQIVRQRNFQLFVGMNFLQIFHSTFASSFYTIFEDSLLGSPFDSSARAVRSVIAGASGSIPQLAVLFFVATPPHNGVVCSHSLLVHPQSVSGRIVPVGSAIPRRIGAPLCGDHSWLHGRESRNCRGHLCSVQPLAGRHHRRRCRRKPSVGANIEHVFRDKCAVHQTCTVAFAHVCARRPCIQGICRLGCCAGCIGSRTRQSRGPCRGAVESGDAAPSRRDSRGLWHFSVCFVVGIWPPIVPSIETDKSAGRRADGTHGCIGNRYHHSIIVSINN
eukprot:Opistho-2@17822